MSLVLLLLTIRWVIRNRKKKVIKHLYLMEGTISHKLLYKAPMNMEENQYLGVLGELIHQDLVNITHLDG